jgi:hypothetical protein
VHGLKQEEGGVLMQTCLVVSAELLDLFRLSGVAVGERRFTSGNLTLEI